jgi:hypothetical protein
MRLSTLANAASLAMTFALVIWCLPRRGSAGTLGVLRAPVLVRPLSQPDQPFPQQAGATYRLRPARAPKPIDPLAAVTVTGDGKATLSPPAATPALVPSRSWRF